MGTSEGMLVGIDVGTGVGEENGNADGAAVGSAVGSAHDGDRLKGTPASTSPYPAPLTNPFLGLTDCQFLRFS